MDDDRTPAGRIVRRVVLVTLLIGAAYFFYDAMVSDDAPAIQWIASIAVLVLLLPMALVALRLRLMDPLEREARLARIQARQEQLAAARPPRVQRPKDKERILSSGQPATAIIHAIKDGGAGNQFRTRVSLELEVRRDGRAPYRVYTSESVAHAATGILVPGYELVVKIDPMDEAMVAVDWDESLRLR